MLSTLNAACCKYPLCKTNKCPVNELIHDFRYLPNYTIVNLFFRVVYDITNCELSVSYQYMYHYRFLFHLMHLSSIYKDQVNTLIVTVHECLYIVYHEQLGIMRHIL